MEKSICFLFARRRWGFYNRVDVASDKKPPKRLRMGSGWWKLVPPMGAEINCEFPGTVPVMSVSPGARRFWPAGRWQILAVFSEIVSVTVQTVT